MGTKACVASQRRESESERDVASHIAGRSEAARRLRDRVCALAPLRVPVLVTGEPGTGHDHVVHCLHAQGGADRRQLVRVVAARAAAPLRESAAAVYLDEIGRFSPHDQRRWFESVRKSESAEGGRAPRIFASSSEDLESLVRSGTFYAPLAQALVRFRIPLAPLRERREDVAPLLAHLAGTIGARMGREQVRFDRAAVGLLRSRAWPGNVRELASVVEKLVAFSPDGVVTRWRVSEVLGEAPDSVAALRRQKSQRQREELVCLLEACGGNLAEVARRLEISRGAVIYRAQKFGLLSSRS